MTDHRVIKAGLREFAAKAGCRVRRDDIGECTHFDCLARGIVADPERLMEWLVKAGAVEDSGLLCTDSFRTMLPDSPHAIDRQRSEWGTTRLRCSEDAHVRVFSLPKPHQHTYPPRVCSGCGKEEG